MAELPYAVCVPKRLPRERWVKAAAIAHEENPLNFAPVHRLAAVMPSFTPDAERIAVVTTKWWRTGGVHLGVKFLDTNSTALKNKILSHMNAWSKTANVKFVESGTGAEVRIAFTPGDGHWSFVGTDILSIPASRPTMNLDSFDRETRDSEFFRVVRHETGHTMGCPHEHMRKALVNKIDERKAIAYFKATQGWSEQETRQQVLTPIEESTLRGTAADPKSIMCYQLPGTITKDGNPILGGVDIDDLDYEFMGKIYPLTVASFPARTKRKTKTASRKKTAKRKAKKGTKRKGRGRKAARS